MGYYSCGSVERCRRKARRITSGSLRRGNNLQLTEGRSAPTIRIAAMKPKTIVVAGANGKLGELICSQLLTDPAFAPSVHVRALVRRKGAGGQVPTNLQALADAHPQTMQVVPIDYTSRADL